MKDFFKFSVIFLIYLLSQNINAKDYDYFLNLRLCQAYADTLTIKSPIIVKKKGIGYITGKENFDPRKPMDITKNVETCLVVLSGIKEDKNAYIENILWEIRSEVFRGLCDQGLCHAYSPEFNFKTKCKGYEIFESEEPEILVVVFILQIETANRLLDILYDGPYPIKTWKRKIKSKYPYMEYIRVAYPIKKP